MHEAVESSNVARVQSNASNYEGVSKILPWEGHGHSLASLEFWAFLASCHVWPLITVLKEIVLGKLVSFQSGKVLICKYNSKNSFFLLESVEFSHCFMSAWTLVCMALRAASQRWLWPSTLHDSVESFRMTLVLVYILITINISSKSKVCHNNPTESNNI